jgi:hypothetical protein
MNWMLLPPGANEGRHIDGPSGSDGDVWSLLMRAGLKFVRQLLATAHW